MSRALRRLAKRAERKPCKSCPLIGFGKQVSAICFRNPNCGFWSLFPAFFMGDKVGDRIQ